MNFRNWAIHCREPVPESAWTVAMHPPGRPGKHEETKSNIVQQQIQSWQTCSEIPHSSIQGFWMMVSHSGTSQQMNLAKRLSMMSPLKISLSSVRGIDRYQSWSSTQQHCGRWIPPSSSCTGRLYSGLPSIGWYSYQMLPPKYPTIPRVRILEAPKIPKGNWMHGLVLGRIIDHLSFRGPVCLTSPSNTHGIPMVKMGVL